MSLFTHRDEFGVVDYHLIIRRNYGPDRKKLLVSNLPLELLVQSSPEITDLIKNQHRSLDLMGNELLENLSLAVARHPSLSKYVYPSEVLKRKTLPNTYLSKLMKYWNEDMGFFRGTIVSWELEPMKQYVFGVMFERYKEFHQEKFEKEVIGISEDEFKRHMLTVVVWNEFNKLDSSDVEYYRNETFRGFDCFIMTSNGKPVLEFIF